jgi:FtsP/CotA-like multicopper oxidase with cupredoxin domain
MTSQMDQSDWIQETDMTATDLFSRDIAGLERVTRPALHRLRDGDRTSLEIVPVVAEIAGRDVRMIGYNGSIPGPTLHVDQGTEIVVDVTNHGDIETTVHWHGLRLDNRYDGVPVDTQAPIAVGQTFTYRLKFPDPGFYWYHPHLREDYGQEMGMYGTIIVEPTDPAYWPSVDRQLAITLDDVLIEDGQIAPFRRSGPTFTAMGRFGNVLLINGEDRLAADVALDEVVRLHLVNTANTRIFNVALPGARMKLVGGDSGRYQRETLVDEVLLAPSERAIVDVLFDAAGEVRFEHRTPDRTYELGAFSVASAHTAFGELRVDEELAAIALLLGPDRDRAPDKTLAFRSTMPLLYGAADGGQVGAHYVCPMHPEVTSAEAARCPKCGMKLVVATALEGGRADGDTSSAAVVAMHADGAHHQGVGTSTAAARPTHACPMHPEITGSGPTECPICGMWLMPIEPPAGEPTGHVAGQDHLEGDGLEWEDLMPEINRQTDPSNMVWCLADVETGAQNHEIFWTFSVGDRVKIRLVNELGSDHPMHHPFHIHGAGRFLVLARDGEPDDNLVWKDTVLVPAGQTVDILLDVTNPGRWMAHCHIAEHVESGMMFSFDVLPSTSEEES